MFLVSATKLSPVAGYKGIQVDRHISEYSNYIAEIQATSIPNEQHVSGDMCPSTYMYPDTCCSSRTHVSGRHVSWCKRGFTFFDFTAFVICTVLFLCNFSVLLACLSFYVRFICIRCYHYNGEQQRTDRIITR